MTQAEKARQLGVSRQRVWQMLKRAERVCVTCGGESGGRFYCGLHAQQALKRSNDRADRGLCRVCHRKADAIKGYCKRHADKKRENGRRAHLLHYKKTRVDGMNACGVCGGRGHNRRSHER